MTEAGTGELDISERGGAAAVIEHPDSAGRWLLLCDHASNRLPTRYGDLGLGAGDLTRRRLGIRAPAAWPAGWPSGSMRPWCCETVSRLVMDPNRLPGATIRIQSSRSAATPVPGNAAIDAAERERGRVGRLYALS